MPVTDGKKSSFTIPGLKDGDRVLIFMKSGEGSGTNGIFLNITGAKDALGKKIETAQSDTWYRAGGTNWQHERYEGCYHFIKDGDGNMTFSMNSGSMCKLLYIRIYTGQRIALPILFHLLRMILVSCFSLMTKVQSWALMVQAVTCLCVSVERDSILPIKFLPIRVI